MDIFKFMNPAHPTRLDQGVLINGLKSKMWIERYRDAGEFEFTADVETMAHRMLPIGSLISHTESSEVMIVENHEISEDPESPTEVTISGRSFETFFDNRVVGSNKPWPNTDSVEKEYVLPPAYTWNQIVALIRNHIYESRVVDPKDAIPNVVVMTTVTGTLGEFEERIVKRGSLYTRLVELLNEDNLGIKTFRPGVRSPLGMENRNQAVVIYRGEDLSEQVIFTHQTGEIDKADYLWSNKSLKNCALVTGRWLETVVKGPMSQYERRWMPVDGSDIDNIFSAPPTGADRTAALAAMRARGRVALAGQKQIAFIKAEVAKNSMTHNYREHYDVGDIVTVDVPYSETAKMRVSEYVEIEDEDGQNGYPTLSVME